MERQKKEDKIIELLELISKFNNSDIKQIKKFLIEKYEVENRFAFYEYPKKLERSGFLSLAEKNKIDIIGGLPFLLNSSKYFNSNESIKHFSEKFLKIKIPRGNKSRPELIGFITVGIVELPPYETNRIREVLNRVMKNLERGKTNDIFLEWEKAFNSINF